MCSGRLSGDFCANAALLPLPPPAQFDLCWHLRPGCNESIAFVDNNLRVFACDQSSPVDLTSTTNYLKIRSLEFMATPDPLSPDSLQ